MSVQMIEVAESEAHFQGELYIGPLGDIPEDEDLHEAARTDGALIIGHSETGHHHVVEDAGTRMFETADPLIGFLVAGGDHAALRHKRDFDTHPTLQLAGKGAYGAGKDGIDRPRRGRKIVRQREVSPTVDSPRPKWVKAAD